MYSSGWDLSGRKARSGFLEPGDKFCSGHKLVERYKDQLMSIFKDLREDGSYLRVYGEFYGGLYNCRMMKVGEGTKDG